jgi:hypothetical protein
VGIPTCWNPNTLEGLESRLPVRIHRILAKLPHSTDRASVLELWGWLPTGWEALQPSEPHHSPDKATLSYYTKNESFARIGYCLVVYTVPYLGDHLCSGTQCGDCTDPSKAFSLWWQGKVLDIAIDEVSGALSMHAVPPAIQIVVVPAGVTILLGLHNPPCNWIGMMSPSLPGFTIAPCVDSFLCYRIDQAT